MKKGKLIIFIIVPSLLILGFLFYQYFIRIYESTVKVNPPNLFADNQSTVTVSVIPLNGFGGEALFRKASAEFEITEGKSLVEIVSINNDEGRLIFKAKSETGKVVVKVKSKFSLLPMVVEIRIEPNLV